VNFVQTDPNIATIAQIAELGLFWKGPLPVRPQDEIGVAIGRDRLSTKITASEILYDEKITPLLDLQPEPVQHAGYPTEIYYIQREHRGGNHSTTECAVHSHAGRGRRSRQRTGVRVAFVDRVLAGGGS
jgi:hypothetical protein